MARKTIKEIKLEHAGAIEALKMRLKESEERCLVRSKQEKLAKDAESQTQQALEDFEKQLCIAERTIAAHARVNNRIRECLETLRDMKYPGQYYPNDLTQPWSDSPLPTSEDEIFRALSRVYSFTYNES